MPTQNFRVGELLNKRTRNSKTWINFDGSYTTEIYNSDVHYQDENGNWHNINTDLYDEADLDQVDFTVAKEGAEEFRIMKTAASNLKKKNILDRDSLDFQGLKVPFDCLIPRNFKRGYVIGKGQNKLRFIPMGVSQTKGFLDENQKNKITYQDPWNDVDVTLEVLPNGIKETIILKSSESPTKFTFEVDGPLEDDLTAGKLRLQLPWLQDVNGEKRDVSQTIRREGDKTFIDLVADVTGLTYPIVIDPTVTINTESAIHDAYVKSTEPNRNFGNDGYLYFGYDTGSNTDYLPYIKFDLSSIPFGSKVSSAKLNLYCGSVQGPMASKWYVVKSQWDENTITYSNKPEYIPPSGSDVGVTYGEWIEYDMMPLVDEWVRGVRENNGIVIYASGLYGTVSGYFYSSDYYQPGYRPYLTVTYNAAPSAPIVITPNGGETWNAQHTITWNPSTDVETTQGSLRYQIQLSLDNGQTWKDIIALTSPGATSYDYDFTNEPETSLAKIRIRAYDGTSYGPWGESDGVFTIQHNQSPTVPTNLSPSGGVSRDRASVIRLSWQHNDANGDPQAQFDLQWRKQGDTTWNTVTQVTPNQYWDAPANTFPKGTIEWQVRTYDQAGLSSPYSAIALFYAGDKPANPTIIAPANDATVPVANPVVQWGSVGQTAYHVKVLDTNNNLLWEVQATSTNKAQTIQYSLANNTDYKIQVAIKNADGLWSDFVTVTINVSYTPPAVPIVTTTKGEGFITISIDNPTPSGTQPNVSYNDLYRREQGAVTWTRIATNIPADASFVDYTPASEQVYEYYVRAWGDNGTYSDGSVVSESVSFIGVWLHEADNPLETLHQFKLVSDRNENWQPTAAMMQFAGRRLPVAEYDDAEQRTVSVKITLLKDNGDKEVLERIIKSKNTLCYRDARGRKMFCHAFQLPIDDEFYGNTVSLTFEEVSYVEGV